jgi:BirA family transcriptional regulator, biotin operon repressor / biotin---[acetyl-CoA-carboxylase] ligase
MTSYTLLEFDNLESTSDFLKENHSYFPHMTFIRANYQSKGRGQYDRNWSSNASENLLFSILLKDQNLNPIQIKTWIMESLISFIQSFKLIPYYKEPNDIYVEDQKICGILIETKSNGKEYDYVIVGIGLNVNQDQFDKLNATSIKLLTNINFQLKDVFSKLINVLMTDYKKLNQ